jgi:hypothetical protein
MENRLNEILETEIAEMKPPVLNEIEQAAVDAAKKEVERLRKKSETEKYLIDISENDANVLETFIVTDAEWKYTEALGIQQIALDIEKSRKEKKKVFLSATAVEAIFYFLSKVEGNGSVVKGNSLKDIGTFIRILKSVSVAIEKIRKDNDALKEAEFQLASREQGITPEPAEE